MTTMLLRELAGARAVELSHPMTQGMPNHESHPPFLFTPFFRYGDFALADGYQGTNELIVMSGHSGTHLDSRAHVACNGMIFGGHAVEEERRHRGLRHHGIDATDPITGRGLLLDVAGAAGSERLAAGHAITAAELQGIAAAAGVTVQAGDSVLVRTGWSQLWDQPSAYLGEGTGAPGIDASAAEWLADAGVLLVGGDTAVVEHVPVDAQTLPVHMLLLAQRGVLLLENLDLEELARSGVCEFAFLCLPLRLQGASGSPVRPLALVGA